MYLQNTLSLPPTARWRPVASSASEYTRSKRAATKTHVSHGRAAADDEPAGEVEDGISDDSDAREGLEAPALLLSGIYVIHVSHIMYMCVCTNESVGHTYTHLWVARSIHALVFDAAWGCSRWPRSSR